jgi:hypothetical protein
VVIEIEPMDAFRYPHQPLVRRHGPAGYANYQSYRPWLRDEFTFRCVYCLAREQWGRVTGEFDLDHFIPQTRRPNASIDYDNLLYACRSCNLRKGDSVLPDPAVELTAETTRVYPDGTIVGLTTEANEIIRLLCLNSPAWIRWRRIWVRIFELAAENDEELLQELLQFPEDLPNLRACRVPQNTRPDGVEQSYFARRERSVLPQVYLD